MSKKSKKNNEFKKSEVTELSAQVSYTNEQEAKNADNVLLLDDNYHNINTNFILGRDINTESGEIVHQEITLNSNEIETILAEGYEFFEMFSIDNMKERIANGESLNKICSDLKSFIIQNKDTNPDLVQRAISQLLEESEGYYDKGKDNLLKISGFTRSHQGNNSQEVLQKILDTPNGEDLHGFVCSTISEFGMMLLEECGIQATLLCGGTNSTNHTTLLWQRSDGKFVQNNYGASYILDAKNMKDAAREVYKKDLGLVNNGYIYFVDEYGSYQEFAMKDEAVWGRELDKRDYNRQSLFDNGVAAKSSISGNVNFSNIGSISAEVNGVLSSHNENGTASKEIDFSAGYKKNGVTSLADSSTSVGAKLGYKVEKLIDNGKKFSDTKIIVDLTKLHTNETIIGYDKIQPMIDRKIKEPEKLKELTEWFGPEYEALCKRDSLQGSYNFYSSYIENYESKGPAPLTKEEYIKQQHETYKSGDGIPYNELDKYGKSNADKQIEKNYYDYLFNNRYDGGLEIAQEEQNYYKDRIENYEKYKEEFIQKRIDAMTTLCGFNDEGELPKQYTVDAFDTTHVTAFIRKMFGCEKTLLKDGNMELTHGYQLGGLLGFNLVTTSTFAFGGDVRLQAEEGLRLNVGDKNTFSSSAVSGGLVADMSLKSGTLTGSVSPGIKLNGSSVFQKRVNDNVSFGAGVDGYAVVTRQSSDYGVGGQIQAGYKPQGMDIKIFGSADASVDKQQLRIGGFNALSEYVNKLGLSLGVKFNTGAIQFSYSKLNDKMNSTRNRAVFSIGAKINL